MCESLTISSGCILHFGLINALGTEIPAQFFGGTQVDTHPVEQIGEFPFDLRHVQQRWASLRQILQQQVDVTVRARCALEPRAEQRKSSNPVTASTSAIDANRSEALVGPPGVEPGTNGL